MTTQHPKLLFFVTEDWYFCSHRLPLAVAARKAGYDVTVVTRVDRHGDPIRSHGLKLIPIQLSRHSVNPLRDLALITRLYRIYRRVRPDIVHHVAMKPVLYGALAARLAGVSGVVNAMVGMGFIFSSQRLKARLLRPFVRVAFRVLLGGPGSRVIVQNPDDAQLLIRAARLNPDHVHLIRGSGVDLETFRSQPEPPGKPVIMLPSRLLWDKGVGEFAAAAKRLRTEGIDARFVLVGEPDPSNPAAVPEKQISEWVRDDIVEWWGHSQDMPTTLAQSHIVCLPSYREGLPKVLLEAAACGRPIVTTDAPGCREIVTDGENGLLVPVKAVSRLAEALKRLILDPALRRTFGTHCREVAATEFGIDGVTRNTLAVYQQLQV
jgi:glycosyltransferase involved in cell wall biosynthesis